MIEKITLGALLLCGSGLSFADELVENKSIGGSADAVDMEKSVDVSQPHEPTLDSMTISAKSIQDPHTRTELGKLTEATPISGAVIDLQEIEHLQLVNNLLELGKRVPGISMIRNMRIPDGGKQYTENRIDGMRATTNSTSALDEVDLADIERIEVITGPASALYGTGAFGGTFNVFRRQPPEQFTARVSQEFGSYGFKRSMGYAGGTLADGRIGVVLTASTMDEDGWRKNSAPKNNDTAEQHKDGLGLRTVIKPTDSTKVTLGYNRVDHNYRWAGPIPMNAEEAAKLRNQSLNGVNLRGVYFDNDWRDTVPGTYGEYLDEYRTGSFRLQQMVGEQGEFTLAYTRNTSDSTNNGNGGSGGANGVICDTGAAVVTVACATYNVGAPTNTNTIKQTDITAKTTMAMYRQEFDLAKATAYVGAEMLDMETDATTWSNAYSAILGQAGYWKKGAMTATGQGSLSKQTETTPFVHFEFSPIAPLRLHLGKRFARIAYDVDDRKVVNKDVKATVRGDVFRLGATYDIAPGHLVWVGRGETFNPQAATSFVDSQAKGTARNAIGATLKPEEGTTQEIGFRGLFAESALRYDVTFFHARNRNYIASRDCTVAERAALNLNVACTLSENIGAIETKGVESMFSWAATSWLDIGATYTNAKVFFKEYENVSVNQTGNTYQSAPRHKLNLRLGVKPAAGWLVELERDYISEYHVNNANDMGTYKRPNLYSLRASYRGKDWSFWLHALNLTDQKYATRVAMNSIGGVSVLATQAGQGNVGSYTPLTLRLGASYEF